MKALHRLTLAVPLLLVSCGTDAPPAERIPTLDAAAEPLTSHFDADRGKVRAVFLASPACGVCLRGVRELREEWLEDEPSDDLAVYVVWSDQLGAERSHVPDATTLLADERVRHYWDPDRRAGRTVSPHLELDDAAWDVWLLYGRDAVWTGDRGPPEPAWWEHQLRGMPRARYLDPARFARKASELLEAEGPAPVSGDPTVPTAEGPGSDAHQLPEGPGEVTLVGESDGVGDPSQRSVRASQGTHRD